MQIAKIIFPAVALLCVTAAVAGCGGGSGSPASTSATTYTVTYNGNGATGGSVHVDGNKYASAVNVTVLGNTGSLIKTGFRFSDWNTAANGSGTAYAKGATFAMGSSNVVLYAQWALALTNTVTYNGNGATGGSVPVDANIYASGATVTVLSNSGNLVNTGFSFSGWNTAVSNSINLVNTGFTFSGWNTAANGSGTAYAAGASFAMGSSNVVLYAQWTLVPIYTVTYNGNGATGGSVPVDGKKYASGDKVTVLSNSGNLVNTGFSFSGWNTAANGSGRAYGISAIFTMGSGNVVLYAQWVVSGATLTVTYAGNGSTSGYGLPDPNLYAAGSTVTVHGNLGFFFKPGYSFTGWNTSANGSGADRAIGETFTMGTSDLTLFAQWEATDWPPASIWGGARAVTTLKPNGTVWSWGLNAKGQLGNGTTTDSSLPVQVLGPGGTGYLSEIVAVMGGEQHNFALKSDGTVWAWGDNSHAQLGNGTTANSSTPVQVSGLTSIVKLGGRGYHSVAVKSDGTVWTWGWDEYGALGNGVDDANIDYLVPIEVAGVTNPILVTSGFQFSVALMQDHTLMAWGNNLEGEIGDGTTTNRLAPVTVPGIDQVVWVSAGWTHVVAIRADGTVWVWGANNWQGAFDCEDTYDNNNLGFYCGYGMLGDGTEIDHYSPEQVPGLSGAIMAVGGDASTSVLLRDGTVWTFGSNGAGQLGVPGIYQSLVPVQVQGLCSAVYIMTRDFHNEALCTNGTLWSWGSGDNGELGNGTKANSAVPVQVNPY
ncbi:MAG: InlB B-repeat-containing protein [Terracidiphilus sp.]